MEQLNYNLMYRWFVGLSPDDPVWDRTTFTKNRDRLQNGEVFAKFMTKLLNHPQVKPLLSDEHFSVDGTLIEAWASHKGFRPKDGSGDSYMGHATMENQHGLAVAGTVTFATGTAERRASEIMLKAKAKKAGRRITVGEDKAYDTADHVANLRALNVTPHVVQNDSITATGKRRQSAIDGRTTRHKGYGLSQSCRAMIECIFGWGKTARHDAQNKTSRHNQGYYRFDAQSDRLRPDAHSQVADGLADSAHNHPVAPRARRQRDRKSATLQVLQRTARAIHSRRRKHSAVPCTVVEPRKNRLMRLYLNQFAGLQIEYAVPRPGVQDGSRASPGERRAVVLAADAVAAGERVEAD